MSTLATAVDHPSSDHYPSSSHHRTTATITTEASDGLPSPYFDSSLPNPTSFSSNDDHRPLSSFSSARWHETEEQLAVSSPQEAMMTTTTPLSAASHSYPSNLATEDLTGPASPGPETGPHHNSSCVQVAVRVRPLLALEAGTDSCIQVLWDPSSTPSSSARDAAACCGIRIGGPTGPRFTFDRVFDPHTTQEQVYQDRVAPLVRNCLEGYNATILAYGQTGSGKTYTIMGAGSTLVHDSSQAGVIPRAIRALFAALQEQRTLYSHNKNNGTSRQSPVDSNETTTVEFEYQVRVQFLELYGEDIRDLLTADPAASSTKLTIRDLGEEPEVVGASQPQVESAEEALLCLTHGMLRRVTGSTAMNESSSRSHALLSVMIEQSVTTTSTPPATGPTVVAAAAEANHANARSKTGTNVQVKRSKFNFVDLAGSERQKRTLAEGKRLKEGIDINKGLLVLGNVVSALGDPKKQGKTFVPYRDSKLTRLLKGSLGGNHKTLMIACVSPSSNNLAESLNCLRYANRAKNIQNNAVINMDANSRLVAELRSQVQVLAQDLLRAWDGESIATLGHFTRETLVWMASPAGNGGEGALSSPNTTILPSVAKDTSSQPMSPLSSNQQWSPSSTQHRELERRLYESEMELNKTRALLRQSQTNHDTAEEELYVAKAERQMLQLQLSVTSDDESTIATPDLARVQEAFISKTTEYEKEIGRLREELRKRQNEAWLSTANGDDAMMYSIANVRQELEEDRERLEAMRVHLLGHDVPEPEEEEKEHSLSESAEEEERREQARLETLTSKYLAQGGHDDDENEKVADESNTVEEVASEVSPEWEAGMQADLVDLSRRIKAKEDLISQLQCSQEKYANMRDFYEEKLRRMEVALHERELERDQLVQELELAKQTDTSSKHLEDLLREKEDMIATMKRKHKELKDLTTFSARNAADIEKLQSDVTNMKKRKVELQKQLEDEKKNHANEVKRLKKEATQRERELSRVRLLSNRREAEAERAGQLAKNRSQELVQLRAKYKDAEKQLRLMSLKRGVMAKAGLDSVIVGRRDSAAEGKIGVNSSRDLNVDAIRTIFDEKVARVVRQEALVDRLAQEWEEHLELTRQKTELMDEKADEGMQDALQCLDVQIQFKESKIRQLALRLSRQKLAAEPVRDTSTATDFIFDTEFHRLCEGVTLEHAKGMAARVLFGMIVRERRRIAALARAASFLEEKLQKAEEGAQVSESALRSFIEEHKLALANLSQSQQEHLLSLMELVKQDSEHSVSTVSIDLQDAVPSSQNLLILANERIALLERQLQELRLEASANVSYKVQIDELSRELDGNTKELAWLREEQQDVRASLRQIRELATHGRPNAPPEDVQARFSSIVEAVNQRLHGGVSRKPRKSTSSVKGEEGHDRNERQMMSPRFRKHFELMHSSDSGMDGDEPEWAAEIMADLNLIAEGKLPPSLEGAASVVEAASQFEKDESVFERLSDPRKFTGTQKLTRAKSKGQGKRSSPTSPVGQEARREMSKQISDRLDKISLQDAKSNRMSNDEDCGIHRQDVASKERSVFERLVSPSQYTGIHKEKLHGKKVPAKRNSDVVAERLLEDLLHSDNEASEQSSERTGVARTIYFDYTQQDVFERLQKTTTQAYAVKHNPGSLTDDAGRDTGLPVDTGSSESSKYAGGRVVDSVHTSDKSMLAEYTKLDVFERLQKTTTEAYAKKTNKGKH